VAAPVSKGQELELRIDSLAYGGNGVARMGGFVVFVRNGLPGDLVRAQVTKVKKGYAEAFRTQLVEGGPQRVEPRCPHFGACGGCRFQDFAYDAQLEAKVDQVRESLRRLGGIDDPPLEPAVPALEQYGYRNKLEFSFTQTDEGPDLGFHRAGRWDEVLAITGCHIAGDAVNAVRAIVRDWARSTGLSVYDQREHVGYLRHLLVREGRNTGQLLVVLVTGPGDLRGRDELVSALQAVPQVKSIHWGVNEGQSEITGVPTKLLWGSEWIEERILQHTYRLRPGAFLQTNTLMAEKLYEVAVEMADLKGGETVYDLYCGIGTISLTMAEKALTVWGIEVVEEAVACALENAEINGVPNVGFFAGNVGVVLDELRQRSGDPDLVIVDPPRAGLAGRALRRLAELQAPRIVYVSCNPTTLAGDLKVLCGEAGYELKRVRPVDMFPHTPHVECVALLELDPARSLAAQAAAAAAAAATDAPLASDDDADADPGVIEPAAV
jgi:23S rRNA (uracil1939-C5)-methyltransferase